MCYARLVAAVRRRVSLLAIVWLLSHVTTIGLSFAGLCCDMPSTSAAGDDEDLCCQGLAPGQMCPLHKHGSHETPRTPKAPSPDACAMSSGCDPMTLVLAASMLDLSLLPEIDSTSDHAGVTVVLVETTRPVARAVLPDFPPPRT